MQTEEKKSDSKLSILLQEIKVHAEKANTAINILPKLTSEIVQACQEWSCKYSDLHPTSPYYYREISEFRDSFYVYLTHDREDDYDECVDIVTELTKKIMCEITKHTNFIPKEYTNERIHIHDKEGKVIKTLRTNVGTIGTETTCTIILERNDASQSTIHALFFCMVDKITLDTVIFLIDAWSVGGTTLMNTTNDEDIERSELVKDKNGRRLMMVNLSKDCSHYFSFGYSKQEKFKFVLKHI